jgi:hypothetical protein
MMIPALFVASLLLAAPAGADMRLAEAAMKRDTATVRSLLSQKIDVNAPGKDGTPALHWVVRVDDLETAQLLIKAGADVKFADRYGVTPIYLATMNGNAGHDQAVARCRSRLEQRRSDRRNGADGCSESRRL